MGWWGADVYNTVAMQTVAILGAGELGGAVGRALACRDLVSRIVFIDKSATVAAGKALDIRQSGPVEGFDTRLDGTDDLTSIIGASVVVLADDHDACTPTTRARSSSRPDHGSATCCGSR